MLLSAQEHLELYDSPIVIDLDAGERPPCHHRPIHWRSVLGIRLLILWLSEQDWGPSASLTTSSNFCGRGSKVSSTHVTHIEFLSSKGSVYSSGFMLSGDICKSRLLPERRRRSQKHLDRCMLYSLPPLCTVPS